MAEEQVSPSGPDLAQGVSLADLVNGKLVGHVGDQDVLVVVSETGTFAIDAHCSHYHGPLVDGLVVDGQIRCPWHHAAFDLQTGEATRAPAFNPLSCWRVEQSDDKIFVREKRKCPLRSVIKSQVTVPEKIVIVGNGAAGFAAAEMLRRQDFQGRADRSPGSAFRRDRPQQGRVHNPR